LVEVNVFHAHTQRCGDPIANARGIEIPVFIGKCAWRTL